MPCCYSVLIKYLWCTAKHPGREHEQRHPHRKNCPGENWVNGPDWRRKRSTSTGNWLTWSGPLLRSLLYGNDECRSETLSFFISMPFNTRQWRSVGGATHPLPWVFLKWPANGGADRAESLHTLWSILYATFDEKNLTGVGQVTEP